MPARLFFNDVIRGNLSVLGENCNPEQLEAAYFAILDEYCLLDNNRDILDTFKKEETISRIRACISTLEMALITIVYSHLTKDQRIEIIDNLNEWKAPNPKINFNKDAPIDEEIKRIKSRVIGGLKNQLAAEESTRKKQVNNIVRTFEDDIVSLSKIQGYNIPIDISLRLFIAYSKSAKETAKKYNNGK